MAALPLQEHVADHAVPVPVQAGGVLFVGVHQNITLEHRGLLGVRSDVIQFLPPVHVLLHRLPVEEHHGDARVHGPVDDDGRRGAVHDVHAQSVVAQGDEAFHLAVLGVLVQLGVHNVHDHLDSRLLLVGLGPLLQGRPDRADKGVVAPVQGHPDADRGFGRRHPAASEPAHNPGHSQSQRKGCRGPAAQPAFFVDLHMVSSPIFSLFPINPWGRASSRTACPAAAVFQCSRSPEESVPSAGFPRWPPQPAPRSNIPRRTGCRSQAPG